MATKAATIKDYLAALPPERRQALLAVRDVIRKNLDKDIEEGMQSGMLGYYVPHSVYPDGYHCNPKEPLPVAGLGNQKNHMSLYMLAWTAGRKGRIPGRRRARSSTWAKPASASKSWKTCRLS